MGITKMIVIVTGTRCVVSDLSKHLLLGNQRKLALKWARGGLRDRRGLRENSGTRLEDGRGEGERETGTAGSLTRESNGLEGEYFGLHGDQDGLGGVMIFSI
jgi:hypothetical protein